MLVIALTALSVQAIAAGSLQLDGSRVSWESVSFRASKLFFSLDTEIGIAQRPASDVVDSIIAPQTGVGVELAPDLVQLDLGTDLLGRRNDMILLVNAKTGEAVQRTTHESGNRHRHRVYRFTDIGAYHDTRKAANDDEEKLPRGRWPEWTNHSTGLYAYPEEAVGPMITEPGALLYIVGAARLDKPGDYLEVLAYARKRVHRVHIDVDGLVDMRANYTRIANGQSIEERGERTALRLYIEGDTLGEGDPDDGFEMLGLRGKLELLIDPQTRAPLRLSGRAKIVGNVTLRARKVVVATARNE